MPKVLRTNSSEDGTDRPAVTDHAVDSDPRDLNEIASEVGHAHAQQAEAKTSLEKGRKAFFSKLTSKHRASARAKKTIIVPQPDLIKAEEMVAKYYPGWSIISARPTSDNPQRYRFMLEEDPEFIGDQVTTGRPDNPGFVVTRTIRSGTTLIDLDRMKVEKPELYEQVTFVPEPERQAKPESELTPKQIEAIRPYIYEDKRTVALNVRKAKPEDYDEG
jgi:hypothetical protein